MLSASQKVWFRADSGADWLRGEVKEVTELEAAAHAPQSNSTRKLTTTSSASIAAAPSSKAVVAKRAEFKIELQDDSGALLGEVRSVVSSPVEGSFEEYDLVKPRNKEDDDAEGAEGVEDLISLHHLHEPAILSCLQKRFEKNIVYTNTGPILIAVVRNYS